MRSQFAVTGMTCAACAAHVEKAVSHLPGVHTAGVNLMLGSMTVDYDEAAVTEEAIIAAVIDAGYGIRRADEVHRNLHAEQDTALQAMKRRLTWSIGLLLPLFYLGMGRMLGLPLPGLLTDHPAVWSLLQLALCLPILLLNKNYFTVGFSRLIQGSPNMDSLVALGASAGLAYSLVALIGLLAGRISVMPTLYFESAGMILTLVSVGKFLEQRSRGKTTDAITALMKTEQTKTSSVV